MRHILIAGLTAMLLLVTAPAQMAEVLPHEGAGVKVWVPDNWAKDGDEDSLIVNDPNEEIMFAFLVVDASETEAALEALETELSEIVSNVQTEDDGEEIQLNGMDGFVLDGTGSVEGTPVELGVMLLETPSGKVLMVLAIVEASKAGKHEGTVEKIMKRIKPL